MRKIFYKRNLPHYQPEESCFFVTFRLANSLPKSVVTEYFKEKDILVKDKNSKSKLFLKFDQILDRGTSGSMWLKDRNAAKIVYDAIMCRDKKEYDLICFCIMPNHVHLVAYLGKNEDKYPLTAILRKLKSYTAMKCNECLNRSGKFWHSESYDHVIRNEKSYERIIRYVLNNPVKANLVENWEDWEWSYFNEDIQLDK